MCELCNTKNQLHLRHIFHKCKKFSSLRAKVEKHTFFNHMNYTHSCPLTQSLQMNVSSELYCCKHILISCICGYFLFSPPPHLLLLQQEQLEVFTDEHLLFTTPRVIAHASSQLQITQAQDCQRIWCLIFHASLYVVLVCLLKHITMKLSIIILLRYPKT